jgi:hypothetical protein
MHEGGSQLMKQLWEIFIYTASIAVLGVVLMSNTTVWADEGHARPEKKKEMHHHAPSEKKGPNLPPGTEELRINLSGPFCSKHPEEISAELMKLMGVLHIEAFSGRNYILVHYNGKHGKPDDMVKLVDELKGSGWRCDAVAVPKGSTGQ